MVLMKCNLLSIWYNIRYFKHFILNGYIASAHGYEYTGEIHHDHWQMKCRQCGNICASEVGPNSNIEEIN